METQYEHCQMKVFELLKGIFTNTTRTDRGKGYQHIQNKDHIPVHVLHLKLIHVTLLNSMFNLNSQNKRDQLLPVQMRNSTDLHLN